MRDGFWRDPDAVVGLLLTGLAFSIPGILLGCLGAKPLFIQAPYLLFLGILSGIFWGFAAALLVVYLVWFLLRVRLAMIKEIREVVPNLKPLTFWEKATKQLDFRKCGEGDLPWRS